MNICEDCIWFEDYEIDGEAIWRGCLKSNETENCDEFLPAPKPIID